MKIGLIGYGKTGSLIEKMVLKLGHEIAFIVAPHNPKANYKFLQKDILHKADACIDFSVAEITLDNAQLCAEAGVNLVIGTSGWYQNLSKLEAIVKKNKIGVMYGGNFSLGMHLFLKMVKNAAHLIDKFEDYDVGGVEIHHKHKKDSPSATADLLGKILLEEIKRKDQLVYGNLPRAILPNELNISSCRVGEVPGTHQIFFDSAEDSITLVHEAKNREGFAKGAVKAVEWLQGKRGLYTVEDLIMSL